MQGQGREPQIIGYVNSPGLIQSLLKIFVRIGTLLYNVRHRDPEIGSIPPSEPGGPPREEQPRPLPNENRVPLPPEFSKLLDDVNRLKSDYELVKDGSLIEKIIGAKRLRADIETARTDAKAAADLAKQTAADVKTEVSVAFDGIKNKVETVRMDLSLLKGDEGRLAQIEAAVRLAKNGVQDLERGKHFREVISSEFRKSKEDGDGKWSGEDTTHTGIVGISAMLLGIIWKLTRGKEREVVLDEG